MNRNKTVLYNIASTAILQGIAFLSGPVFSGLLGTANYGIAAVYLTWVQLASTIFTLQAGGTLAIARSNFPIEDQDRFQSSVLSLSSILYASFSLITIVIVYLTSGLHYIDLKMVIIGLCHGWGIYCVTFLNSKFTYEFKANRNFILSITTTSLSIVSSIILIQFFSKENNYWGRIIGQGIVYLIIGVFVFAYIFNKGRVVYNLDYWKFTLPIAIPTVFHTVSGIVLTQSDKVMIQKMVSDSDAGIYALAFTFASVINAIKNALNNSWSPYYFEYTRKNEILEMKRHAKNYIELFTVLSIGFIFLSREFFHIYANKSFWAGTNYIPMFVLSDYFVFLYTFSVNFEFYYKKTKSIAVGTSLAAVCNIVLNFILIRSLGGEGAVLATIISHCLLFLFHYILVRRMKVAEFPFRLNDYLPWFALICLTCFIYMITREYEIIRWIVAIIIGLFEALRIIRRKEIF